MIDTDSLTKQRIDNISKKYKSDPILIEKMLRALYLLEQLQNHELDFIFKGGTALMLLFSEPKRFSIDIDIIIPEKPENIEAVFDSILQDSDFIDYSQDKRLTSSDIEKAHYKFYYEPKTRAITKEEYILLDILYEESHYETHTTTLEITSPFILSKGRNASVIVPTPEAILGDKLTAFAPKTTGIPYGVGKEVEIIKQLFDIGHLFDIVENTKTISEVFNRFAKTELSYRTLKDHTPTDVLQDILNTALVIATRGKAGEGNFSELQQGIKNIRNYIFSENFHLQRAMIPTAKSAYLSSILQTNAQKIERFTGPTELTDWIIEQPFETRLNKLKKSNPEAFFYWYKTYKNLIRL